MANKEAQDDLGPAATADMESAVFNLEAVGIIALVVSVLTTILLSRAIARPIVDMTGAMTMLANGDHAVRIPAVNRTDEVGLMARAVQVFRDNALESERLRQEQAESEKQMEAEKKRATLAMADDLETSVKGVAINVASAVQRMETTAKSMSASSDRTGTRAQAVAAASEEATVTAQAVASAAEQLSQSIQEITRQISEASAMTATGHDRVKQTNATVQDLAAGAQRIGSVVQLIHDIAEQTNLLALNATIEAARR